MRDPADRLGIYPIDQIALHSHEGGRSRNPHLDFDLGGISQASLGNRPPLKIFRRLARRGIPRSASIVDVSRYRNCNMWGNSCENARGRCEVGWALAGTEFYSVVWREYSKRLAPDNPELDHMRVRLNIDRGQVVDFVVQHEIAVKSTEEGIAYLPAVRFDATHGRAHMDYLSPAGGQSARCGDPAELTFYVMYAVRLDEGSGRSRPK